MVKAMNLLQKIDPTLVHSARGATLREAPPAAVEPSPAAVKSTVAPRDAQPPAAVRRRVKHTSVALDTAVGGAPAGGYDAGSDGARTVDGAPSDREDLAAWAEELPLAKLAHAWVAALTDAVDRAIEDRAGTAAIARFATVVRRRLFATAGDVQVAAPSGASADAARRLMGSCPMSVETFTGHCDRLMAAVREAGAGGRVYVNDFTDNTTLRAALVRFAREKCWEVGAAHRPGRAKGRPPTFVSARK